MFVLLAFFVLMTEVFACYPKGADPEDYVKFAQQPQFQSTCFFQCSNNSGTAVYIGPKTCVTAKHCVSWPKRNLESENSVHVLNNYVQVAYVPVDTDQYIMTGADASLKSLEQPQDIRLAKVIAFSIHPDPETDLAILHLDRRLPIKPAKLPTVQFLNKAYKSLGSYSFTSAGYGGTTCITDRCKGCGQFHNAKRDGKRCAFKVNIIPKSLHKFSMMAPPKTTSDSNQIN